MFHCSNMATSLIHHERIMTTTARAKELRRFVEKLIKFGKRGDNHGFREAMRVLKEESAGVKLMEILGPRYMSVYYSWSLVLTLHRNRSGGYTRIIKLGMPRHGDSSDLSYIEFVDREGELRRARPGKPIINPLPPQNSAPTEP